MIDENVCHWINKFGIKPKELSNEIFADTLHVLNHNDEISGDRVFELIEHILFLNQKIELIKSLPLMNGLVFEDEGNQYRETIERIKTALK